MPRPYSYSQLRMFAQCPKLYYYVYECGMRIPPAFPLVEGRAYHKTLEHANRQLVVRAALSPQQFVDHYAYALTQALTEEADDEGVEASSSDIAHSVDAASRILPAYATRYYQQLRPESIEHRFDTEISGAPFCGIADVVEADRVIDYKVVGTAHGVDVVANSPQLLLYSHCLARPRVAHIQLIRRSGDVVLTEAAPEPYRKSNALLWAKRTIADIEGCRRSSVWPSCSPEDWRCSPRYCGFYGLCYTKGE